MHTLFHLIEQFGIAVVFANVLVEQLGAPVPAYPTLVIAGALLSRAEHSPVLMLAGAVMAAQLADLVWYWAGKRLGRKALSTLCRISLSPDSCVRQTESLYARWGAPSLLVAKFVPGFATVANALAGTLATPLRSFILYNIVGTAIWAGSAMLLGSLFSTAIDDLLNTLELLGKYGALLLLSALAVYVLHKWWQRESFLRALRMARISVDELQHLQRHGAAPLIIDVRSSIAQGGGRIPGATVINSGDLESYTPDVSHNAEIVLYCACPNEASAALVAKQLIEKGFKHVRPLAGGIDAWIAAGLAIET